MTSAETIAGLSALHIDWPKQRNTTNSLLRFHDAKHNIDPASIANGNVVSMTDGKFRIAIIARFTSVLMSCKTLIRRKSSIVWIRVIVTERPKRHRAIQPLNCNAKYRNTAPKNAFLIMLSSHRRGGGCSYNPHAYHDRYDNAGMNQWPHLTVV